MDNQRRSLSAVLSGSEARHNTPIQDTFNDIYSVPDCDHHDDKDIEKERWMLSRNSSLINNVQQSNVASSRSDELDGDIEMASQFSEIHSGSRLPEKSNSSPRCLHCQGGRKSSSFQDLAPRHQPKDTTCDDRFHPRVDVIKQNLETSQSSQMGSNKCVVSLPKIDTYCISQTRPVANHGFAYMVSAYDLINAKNSTPRRQTIKKSTQNVANSSSGNGFLPTSADMFLLFRAPSRVCGLKWQPFTVKTTPKRKRQCKRSKEFQKTKEVKTNILRLPDIN